LVYAVNHSFIKSSMLMITGVISSRTMTKTARLTELGGVGKTMPWVGGLYLVGGLALAGVPPLNGFISKVTLVQSGIEAQEWLTLGLVVAAGALTLLYITRTWQLIFLQDPDEALKLKPYGDSVLAPSLLIALCVTLGVFASPLISLALRAVEQMGDPTLYIRAVLGG